MPSSGDPYTDIVTVSQSLTLLAHAVFRSPTVILRLVLFWKLRYSVTNIDVISWVPITVLPPNFAKKIFRILVLTLSS
jgi:hypothetical protein